jgi:MoaA/NifB/PqqE/SkfB family radical SAM enzyme
MAILNTNLKIFHYPDKIDSLPGSVSTVLPPIHVRIKPTNICNHDCWFCAYRQDDFQLGQTMVERDQIPFDKMMEIVDDLIEMKVQAVTFSGGGEPFVYPHLLTTVQRLAKAGIPFASLTNGSRLSGEVAEVFAEHGIWVRVSLDGWDGPSYAKARHTKETEFEKVLGNMKAFKKLGGRCYLSTVIVVGHDNGPHIHELVSRLAPLGIDSIKISPVIVSNDGAQNTAYHESHFQLVKDQVARAIQDFGHYTEISDAFDNQLHTFDKAYTWCPMLQIRPVIGADLNIYSCQDKAYNPDGLLFSIKDRRFKDAWMDNKAQFLRVNPTQHCNHHCVAHGSNKLLLEYLDADPNHLPFV